MLKKTGIVKLKQIGSNKIITINVTQSDCMSNIHTPIPNTQYVFEGDNAPSFDKYIKNYSSIESDVSAMKVSDTILNAKTVGTYKGTIKITYKDGSSDIVSVSLIIVSLKYTFEAKNTNISIPCSGKVISVNSDINITSTNTKGDKVGYDVIEIPSWITKTGTSENIKFTVNKNE